MKKIKVFLDDIRIPGMAHNASKGLGSEFSETEKWVIIRDYFEFVDFVKNNFNKIKLISLDHDLACYQGEKEFTGKDAANFLINYCLDNNEKFPSWYVHSDNTSGKNNIIGSITNYLRVVERYDISNFRYFHNGILNGKPV